MESSEVSDHNTRIRGNLFIQPRLTTLVSNSFINFGSGTGIPCQEILWEMRNLKVFTKNVKDYLLLKYNNWDIDMWKLS